MSFLIVVDSFHGNVLGWHREVWFNMNYGKTQVI